MLFMEREPNIFGKNLTPEDTQKASENLVKYFEKAALPMENEVKKTPEEIKVIEKTNEYLAQEFSELGIEKIPEITPEQFHILGGQKYNALTNEENPLHPQSTGTYSSRVNGVIINKAPSRGRLALYKTILHEAVHMASFQSHHIDKEEARATPYRVGYTAYNTRDDHEHFRALNEAVADKTVVDLLVKHREDFIKELNVTQEEIKKSRASYYRFEMDVLNVILEKIASEKKEDVSAVWQRFKKGQFTGDMLHLKDIEHIFGKGALRVLSAMDYEGKDLPPKEVNRLVWRYFKEADNEEREQIAQKITGNIKELKYAGGKELPEETLWEKMKNFVKE